jgi:DNA-binding transcriptional ArsR family regulator
MLPSTDPFAALGDENRRTILRLLTDGERSVGDLASSMPISRPAVSRHLRLLKEAGLVRERGRRDTPRLYALDDLGAEAMREYIESVWGEAMARLSALVAENSRRSEQRLDDRAVPARVRPPGTAGPRLRRLHAGHRSLVAGQPHPDRTGPTFGS